MLPPPNAPPSSLHAQLYEDALVFVDAALEISDSLYLTHILRGFILLVRARAAVVVLVVVGGRVFVGYALHLLHKQTDRQTDRHSDGQTGTQKFAHAVRTSPLLCVTDQAGNRPVDGATSFAKAIRLNNGWWCPPLPLLPFDTHTQT